MDEYTEPDYESVGLITIDMQNDFSLKEAVFEITDTDKVIPNVVRILRKFREKNKLIVHVVRFYKEDGSNVDICRKKKVKEGLKTVAPNSEGAELVKEIRPNNKKLDSRKLLNGEIQEIALNEFIMYKSRWGAFYKTSLENFLKEKTYQRWFLQDVTFQTAQGPLFLKQAKEILD